MANSSELKQETGVVKVKLSRAGIGSVTLNDIDIGRYAKRLSFHAEVGEPIRISLELIAELEGEFDEAVVLARVNNLVDVTSIADASRQWRKRNA